MLPHTLFLSSCGSMYTNLYILIFFQSIIFIHVLLKFFITFRILDLPQSQYLATSLNSNHQTKSPADTKGDSDKKATIQRYITSVELDFRKYWSCLQLRSCKCLWNLKFREAVLNCHLCSLTIILPFHFSENNSDFLQF